MDNKKYKKRAGTSSIQGHLYESKLISLIYFRMIHDDNVDQFSLATNRDDVGAFDDICFKAKIKGFKKPVNVFIQAKHKEKEKLLTFTSKTDLAKYFDSYIEIRRAFDSNSKDMFFEGKFDEIECFFVMYTTAKEDSSNTKYEDSFADYLNELIGTGGCYTQPSYTDESLDFLCKIVMKEEIITLATQLAKFISNEADSVMSMNDDLMLRYHVILAHNVVHVSEIQPQGYRIASFRQDFFTTNEEFIVLFKNILCLEVLKKRKSEDTNVQSLLLKFLSEPSEVTTLSKLIGRVLTYKNNKLEFVSKSITDDLQRQLDKANVSHSTVYEAAELAAKEDILSLKLKVAAIFGNKDLVIRGKPEKIEKRLNYLTSKIIAVLEKSNLNNIVTIDESLGEGFLQLNGGIASAVGNILVFDKGSKLLKFTDHCESLGNLAKTLYESLKSKNENLYKYKIDVKVKKFPKLSFERGEYDVSLVRDFYNKLIFYTNQADQNGIEKILRGEIEDHPCTDVNNFRVRSDVIFLKYHNEIQSLWMLPKEGLYLTKESNIYQKAVTDAMREPLMGVLNIMHKIKYKDYTFNENALKPFELHGHIIGTIIATENCELTVAKVEQYLVNKNRVLLDLENIFKLPLKNHNTLCKELKNTTEENILIIVCHNFQDSKNIGLQNIAKAIEGKQIIIITNKNSVAIITQYFSQARNVLNDERAVFTDLSVELQKKFLATSRIKFQGKDVSLGYIIGYDESVRLIDEDVFNKLINNETIEIGDLAINNYYEKQVYIDRRVSRIKKHEDEMFDDVKDKVLETFYDLEEDVVSLKGEVGMGKTFLLYRLSLKTKELDPKVWIVKIDIQWKHYALIRKLSECDWKGEHTLNTLESLKFLCQVALGEKYDERKTACVNSNEILIELEESPNGTVSLKKFSGGKSTVFQLKMFLYFYNRGKLIFVIDNFQHGPERVLPLLRSMRSFPRKHKIWMTFTPYYRIESDYLKQEFGRSYKLENLSRLEQDTYLNTLLNLEIKLKNLSFRIKETDDFKKLSFFFAPNSDKRVKNNPYWRGYVLLLDFLKMESTAAGIDFPYDKYYNNFMRSLGLCESTISCFPSYTTLSCLHGLPDTFKREFFYPVTTERREPGMEVPMYFNTRLYLPEDMKTQPIISFPGSVDGSKYLYCPPN